MKITVLGSGTLFPTKKRFSSSFLLEEKGTKILIDCGHCALARLVEMNIDPREIDIIFISHFHADHFGDVFNLVHSRFVGDLYEGKKKHKPIILIGPKTLEDRFKKWREIFWPEPQESYPIKFFEGKTRKTINEILIQTFTIKHVPWFDSIGLMVKVNNKTFVYPGDLGNLNNFETLVKRFKGADILFIEAGYARPTPNHFNFKQLEELVKEAEIKKVFIVHIKHTREEEKRITSFIKSSKFDIKMAKDKMVIKI